MTAAMTEEYLLGWEDFEALGRAAATMARVVVPQDMTALIPLTIQLSHDGNVTVYTTATNGHAVPIYDSETDVWAGFRNEPRAV